MQLPTDLRVALESELASLPAGQLAARAAELSRRYRGLSGPRRGFVRSPLDAAAYAASRLPATFAAICAALAQIRARCPEWQPGSCLDAGAGPGTGMWAATAQWPSLSRITCIERDAAMIAFGQRLAAHASLAALQRATWLTSDLDGAWQVAPHDLVIASYVVGELAPRTRERLLERLWGLTRGVLVIIEPGTPEGFARINRRGSGSSPGVPRCSHRARTMGSVRCASRTGATSPSGSRGSPVQRRAKGGTLGYEDEKFSFVAASPSLTAAPIAGRVLRHPQIRKGHVRFELCTPSGLHTRVVSQSDRERYRCARDLHWGSLWQEESDERP